MVAGAAERLGQLCGPLVSRIRARRVSVERTRIDRQKVAPAKRMKTGSSQPRRPGTASAARATSSETRVPGGMPSAAASRMARSVRSRRRLSSAVTVVAAYAHWTGGAKVPANRAHVAHAEERARRSRQVAPLGSDPLLILCCLARHYFQFPRPPPIFVRIRTTQQAASALCSDWVGKAGSTDQRAPR